MHPTPPLIVWPSSASTVSSCIAWCHGLDHQARCGGASYMPHTSLAIDWVGRVWVWLSPWLHASRRCVLPVRYGDAWHWYASVPSSTATASSRASQASSEGSATTFLPLSSVWVDLQNSFNIRATNESMRCVHTIASRWPTMAPKRSKKPV